MKKEFSQVFLKIARNHLWTFLTYELASPSIKAGSFLCHIWIYTATNEIQRDRWIEKEAAEEIDRCN